MGALLISGCGRTKEIPVTTSSDEARNFFVQGREKFENIEYPVAIPLFDQAIAKDNEFALAYAYRAIAVGSGASVGADLKKAQELSENVTEGEQLIISYYQAFYDVNQPKQKECIDKMLQLYPEDKRTNMFAGSYHRAIGDPKTAITYFDKAVALDKDFAPCYNFLGYANKEVGNLEGAEKAFKEYIRLVPNKPNPYDSYAELLLKIGRYDESIVQYQKAYDTDNTFARSLYGIGDNYLFKGNFKKAREYYRMYFDKCTRAGYKLNGLYNIAISYIYENKIDDVLRAFSEYRTFAMRENLERQVVSSYSYEGFALLYLGKASEALKKYDEAIAAIYRTNISDREKANLRVMGNMWRAISYAFLGDIGLAKTNAYLFQQDVEKRRNPIEQNYLQWVLAIIELKEGKYDTAIERYSKVEPNPLTLFHQGQAYVKKGDKENAKKVFGKILNWNQNIMYLAVVWNPTKNELRKM
jgi:tetratricopeptide (TPR) repeat protein